jgi:putative transposase
MRKRHDPEQIILKLREAERELGQGTPIGQVCQQLGIAEQTYYRWKKQFGSAQPEHAKRLKELELENSRLKKIVAEQALDIRILREAARGNY